MHEFDHDTRDECIRLATRMAAVAERDKLAATLKRLPVQIEDAKRMAKSAGESCSPMRRYALRRFWMRVLSDLHDDLAEVRDRLSRHETSIDTMFAVRTPAREIA